ncbi:MAG: YcaO-like family protein [Bacteriovoracaceae bacterium]|nr:YcaO-like family protein [Bacteriovoracaceae bacterium]
MSSSTNITELKVLNWFLKNITPLNLKTVHMEWTKDYLPKYTDMHVEITVNGAIYHGRGTDKQENIAFIKASVEAVERAVLSNTKGIKNSSGVAGHSLDDEAIKNAKLELIERDHFFCHYLTQVPFGNTLINIVNDSTFPFRDMIKKLNKRGIEIFFREMAKTSETTSVICIASGSSYKYPFGITTGHGIAFNAHDAIESAFIQCVRKVVSYLDGELPEKISINEFLQKLQHSPVDHIALGCNLEYAKEVMPFFCAKNCDVVFDDIRMSEIECIQLDTQVNPACEHISSAPLVFYRAFSDQLHDLFFGNLLEENINLNRLKTFANKDISFGDLYKTPHPMG